MAFRKCLLAFAIVALLVAVVPASAQTLTCDASPAGILPVRAEGYTELVGSIYIDCGATTFGSAGQNVVTMGSNVTSKLLTDTSSVAYVAANADGTSPIAGATASYSSANPSQLVFNIPSGAAGRFYLGGIYVDATKYGTSGSSAYVQAILYMTSGSSPVPATLRSGVATVTVGIAQSGLGAAYVSKASEDKAGYVPSVKQCISKNKDLKNGDTAPATADADMNVVVAEGYQTAWTVGSISAPGTAGTIVFTFSNIPSGVTIFVPGVAGNATLAIGAASTGVLTGATAGTAGKAYSLTATSGTATATYFLTAVDNANTEKVTIPVWLQWVAGSSATAVGTSPTVKAELGPVLTGQNTATKTDPLVHRYNTTANTPASLLSVVKCGCSVLFPFVSSAAPFDTGLAVSNTSSDPLGTAAQAGDVTFNFYGASAPAAKTFTAVAGGQQAIFSMSSVATGFTGYVVAKADFQYCYGFAMIMPVGAVGNVASAGYLGISLDGTTPDAR